MNYIEQYKMWLDKANDEEIQSQLLSMQFNQALIEDAFYKELQFGTAGLRGIIGAGTNRMNHYTVAKATQGLANYLNAKFREPSIVIAYDSRKYSKEFAINAAEILSANEINVFIFPRLMPVPVLSYSVRELKASAGIVITASHNPSQYNGYKVYGSDGYQITSKEANLISEAISKIDTFNDIVRISLNAGLEEGLIKYVDNIIFDTYIECVKRESLLFGEPINKDIAIVYSPLSGTGYEPVTRVLKEFGYTNVRLVSEQTHPDSSFKTCNPPNPEEKKAMELGIIYAKKYNADLLLATDPDCDRVGIAIKDSNNEYTLLTGNQVGTLLLDYICCQRLKHNMMPTNPIIMKSLVTTDLAEVIAKEYGVATKNLLIGFKYIGEELTKLDKSGNAESFLLGFEESYGYLTGSYSRDKDAVNATLLICEMFSYYKTRGITLQDKLNSIYEKFGFFINEVISYSFEGINGLNKMKTIMADLRQNQPNLGEKITGSIDYLDCVNGLPSEDILKFNLNTDSVIIRPSGTEPKVKVYINVIRNNKTEALNTYHNIKACTDILFQQR